MISSLTISMLLLAAPPAHASGLGMPQIMPEAAGFSGGPTPAPAKLGPTGAGGAMYGSPGGGTPMGGPMMDGATMDGPQAGSQVPGGPAGGPNPFDAAGLGSIGAPGYCHNCTHYHGGNGYPAADWLFNPCNMYQHYPYWPKYGGYYYFRPYHMIRVAEQRDIAASWGEDPRNPYDHKVFDRVYQAIRAEEANEAEPLAPSTTVTPPATIPAPPLPPSPMPPQVAPPTPVPSPEAPLAPPAPYAPQSSKAPSVIKVKPVSAKMRPIK